ncbi:hypothetical protein ElyMa_000031300 [Elysia marginata]|uniref:Uncharacterized protein n=1 Tax=Elysia marginata TaxID=1093978 RepID=A0AAV4EBW0_9GAST|nr:hypothetical protein ElyMa_000031300 [Elysia marginata]
MNEISLKLFQMVWAWNLKITNPVMMVKNTNPLSSLTVRTEVKFRTLKTLSVMQKVSTPNNPLANLPRLMWMTMSWMKGALLQRWNNLACKALREPA